MDNNDWPSQEYDLQEAEFIVAKYIQEHDGNHGKIVDITITVGDNVTKLRAPEWMVSVFQYFGEKYGTSLGIEISKKVLTRLLLIDKTIH